MFLQSPERNNETFLRYDSNDPAKKNEAGIALLEILYEEVKGISAKDLSKIKAIMY